LKDIERIYDLIKILAHEEEEYFHIIPLLFIRHFEANIFDKKTPALDSEKNIKRIINDLLAK
jgi:hypothetical protein